MTVPLYIQNAYLKEMEAQIIDVVQESEKRWKIELDKTIFYPMSGGQPTDQGTLFTENWEGKVYQALQKGDKILHFISGDTVEDQTSQVLNNIEAILEAQGLTFQDVVKTEVYLKDMNDFKSMNAVYAQRFSHAIKPARQAMQVAKLPLDALVEISCIAFKSSSSN